MKTIRKEHTYTQASQNKNINSKWIANKLMDASRVDPNINYDVMGATLSKQYDVE